MHLLQGDINFNLTLLLLHIVLSFGCILYVFCIDSVS